MRVVAIVLAIVSASCGLDPRFRCDGYQVPLNISGDECVGDECVIDFGRVDALVGRTLRITWSFHECETLSPSRTAILNDGGGVFSLAVATEDVAIVQAVPDDDEPHIGSIDLNFQRTGALVLPLV